MTAPGQPEPHAAPDERPETGSGAAPDNHAEPHAGQEAGSEAGDVAGGGAAGGVRAEARMRLLAARMWVARHRPYYARALFACPIAFTDKTGALSINGHWRIRANLRFAASHTVEQVAAGLIHEINHLLRDHHSRSLRAGVPDEGFGLWKIAADLEVNDDLRDDGLDLPEGVFYPEGVRFEIWLRSDPAELAARYGHLTDTAMARIAETVLSDHPHQVLVAMVAFHPETPSEALEELAASPSEAIREVVASSPTAPSRLLDALARDSHPDVRRAAAAELARRGS